MNMEIDRTADILKMDAWIKNRWVWKWLEDKEGKKATEKVPSNVHKVADDIKKRIRQQQQLREVVKKNNSKQSKKLKKLKTTEKSVQSVSATMKKGVKQQQKAREKLLNKKCLE